MSPVTTCFVFATALTGMLCGASMDQSIKQLPARRIIGVKAFSAYAKAADLRNGVLWYAILGIGSALASIGSAVLAYVHHSPTPIVLPLCLGGVFAICHSVCTSQAAPLYHSQKKVNDDETLIKIFDKFERIQTLRTLFIGLNFLCFIWILINTLAL